YYMTGGSLGGILTALVGAVEPSIMTLAPAAAGAGLSDIAVRSVQRGALQAIWMPILGPIIFGRTTGTPGVIGITYDALDVVAEVTVPLALVPRDVGGDGIVPGDRVRVVNLDNGEAEEAWVNEPAHPEDAGTFRLQIAGDRGDRIALEFIHRGE